MTHLVSGIQGHHDDGQVGGPHVRYSHRVPEAVPLWQQQQAGGRLGGAVAGRGAVAGSSRQGGSNRLGSSSRQ